MAALMTQHPLQLGIKGGVTWIRRCCKGMCSTSASRLISGNHAYAEFFQIQCPNSEKSSKSHACVLCRTKTALLIDWASGNDPRT